MEERAAPWVIIPPTVLTDGRLSAGEKLVYGRVFGFIKEYGYCSASNETLGAHIGMAKNTIRNYLSKLYDYGYLHYELIRGDKGEVAERRIYATLVPNTVLPRTSLSTTPRTAESTKYTNNANVNITNVKETGRKREKEEVEYYAGLLADILNDRKSVAYYRQACLRYNPHMLIQKAKEIIADGGARNPAAVFVGWMKGKAEAK